MYKNYLIIIFSLLFITEGFAQNKVTLSGHMRDASSGEELIGATVFIPELGIGAATNVYGFYSLSFEPGEYEISFSYLGYQTIDQKVNVSENTTVDIELSSAEYKVKEVEITAEAEEKNVKSIEMSVEKLEIKTIKKIPQFLGEVDIIQTIKLLPGVTSVGEGATGFNVRGGNVDQNLILLDETTVYNSSHVAGFFSIFNADALKDVKLYKGGIPSMYGGRLSSILDVRQKEGNMKRYGFSGGIGLLSSRLLVEGPIVKEKGSFMFAGRRSYMDIFTKLSRDEAIRENVLFFYDLNTKLNYRINEKNRIFMSGYFGKDVFGFSDQFRTEWGNGTASLRWNHLFSEKIFSNFTAIFSQYSYSLGVPEGQANSFEWKSKIINYDLKSDFTYFLNPNNKLDFGARVLFYRFKPGEAIGLGDLTFFDQIVLQDQRAAEPAIYVSNEQKFLGGRLTAQYGLRYSMFYNFGEQNIFIYDPNIPDQEPETVIDTLVFDDGTNAFYHGPEPRISFKYDIAVDKSVKLSYNRTRQYIHLVSNTTSATPLDVWRPSGYHTRPATADQIAVGYFHNFKQNMFEFSVEAYFKKFQDLLDYEPGADLLLNEHLEADLLSGEGRAYGLELMLRKNKGKLTGWVSATFARSERLVEGINNDEWYPANYDKIADLSIVAIYEITKNWTVSANFALQSGRPITFPDSRYVIDGVTVPNYNNRNGGRTPAYHRMDVSATWTPTPKEGKRFEHNLNFGLFNLYNRKNPYSIYFRQNEDDPSVTEAVQLSVYGIIIPSITWNFKF